MLRLQFFLILLTFVSSLSAQRTYTVNTTLDLDDGVCNALHCSLREAINAANTDGMPSTIEFNIGVGRATIFLLDALPRITEAETIIDGTTQNGSVGGLRLDCSRIGVQTQDILSIFADETEIYGLEMYNYTISENATMEGAGSMIGVGGIFVPASPTNVKIGAPGKGNVIHSIFKTRVSAANYGNGIGVHSGGNIEIQSNIIGTDTDELIVREIWGQGIRIDETQFGSTYIGGENPGEGNTITGSNRGIGLFGGDGWVKGNRIGFAANGALSNLNEGIILNLGDLWDIGGPDPGEGNNIGQNLGHGISINTLVNCYVGNNSIQNNGSTSNGINITSCPDCIIEENYIEGHQHGVFADDSGNTRVDIRRNRLQRNTESGAYILYPPTARDLVISQNSHVCNGRGIQAGIKGPMTIFDLLRTDNWSSSGCSGIATPNALIEVFNHWRNSAFCQDAFCQGAVYMGSTVADAAGNWNYVGLLPPGEYTCTQTLTQRITSPFSACFEVMDCSTIVTNTNDSGPGSFREAINCANISPGPDTITFAIPNVSAEHLISPTVALPAITDEQLVIDATTQPNGQVVLDGGTLGLFGIGISVEVDSFQLYGITIRDWGLTGLSIGDVGNYINEVVIGDNVRPNEFYSNGTSLNIYINRNCSIQNNYIGNDRTFSLAAGPSNFGIDLNLSADASGILIGGDKRDNVSNFLVNNSIAGIQIRSTNDVMDVSVQGNYFGTDVNEIIQQGNCSAQSGFHGAITLTSLGGTLIGGSLPDFANTFAFNQRAAIYALFNEHKITGNSFYCNETAIDLNSNSQSGNLNKAAPVLTLVTVGNIQGTANPMDTVEVYLHGDDRCPDAVCQGKTLLAKTTANSSGSWFVIGPFSVQLQNGDAVTALAYDAIGNTSSFSECQQLCPDINLTATNGGPFCQGDSIQLFGSLDSSGAGIQFIWIGPNGYSSDEQNPTDATDPGSYFFQVNFGGCIYDLVETVVEINTRDTINIDTTLCLSEFLIVGNERFDIFNSDGEVLLTNSSNCDSLVRVNLDFDGGFFETLFEIGCEGDSILFRGDIYTIDRPMGGDTFQTANGCDSLYSIEVTFIPNSDTIFMGELCSNDSVVINGTVYNESNPSGVQVIMNSAGCDSTITVDYEFNSIRRLSIDTTICEEDEIEINSVTYNKNNLSGSDTLFGASAAGCDSVISVSVSLSTDSRLQVDTMLCDGRSLTFNNITYDQFYPAGSDTLFGQNQFGCDSIINVNILFFDPQIDIDTVQPTCLGGDGSFTITDINGIIGPFNLTFNGIGPLEIDTFPFLVDGLDGGNYIIVIEDDRDCRHAIQLTLDVVGSFQVDVISPVVIANGETTTLGFDSGSVPDSIFWMQGGDTLCVGCETIDVAPIVNTIYTVWVYKDGCSTLEDIEVIVETDFGFYLPNSFSPDGNNINDWFNGFAAADGVLISKMQIFDRWGELIYDGQNIVPGQDEGWDGNFNGELVPLGVYVYVVEVLFPNGDIETRKGSLTVIR